MIASMLTMMRKVLPPTDAQDFSWDSTTASLGNHTIANPNDQAMTIVLGAWSSPRFVWNTSSPVTIAAGGTAVVSAAHSGPLHETADGVAALDWSLAGEPLGSITAAGHYEFPS